MVAEAFSDTDAKMKAAIEVLKHDLGGIRTGRASTALVEHISVDYHGVPTPINQLANISTPQTRLIVIQPYVKTDMPAIEKAILKSDIGLTPTNDGQVVRLAIPSLTEERRRDLVKMVHRRAEESRVAVRNCRRDGLDALKKLEKDKTLSQDEFRRAQERLGKLTDAMIAEVDRVAAHKEQEVLEV